MTVVENDGRQSLLLPSFAAKLDSENSGLKIMNVGCGTSKMGEIILQALASRMEELSATTLVNVDNDKGALEQMRSRGINSNRCGYYYCDYAFDPVIYRDALDSPVHFKPGTFDLVIDKSTLDCLLCTENVASGLLYEAMRLLKPGSCYLVLSFRPRELMEPILTSGLDWESIDHRTLTRQIEKIGTAILDPDDTVSPITEGREVNIFFCWKKRTCPIGDDSALPIRSLLDNHIRDANDAWFQHHNPLLTPERGQEITRAFSRTSGDSAAVLSLDEAYKVLFTDEERDNLDFEYFLQDWNAFLEHRGNLPRERMTLQTALQFLEEMQ